MDIPAMIRKFAGCLLAAAALNSCVRLPDTPDLPALVDWEKVARLAA